ncbi:MAG: rubrerythrin [Planctomycetes bacterium]|nr:rubrerythrin [Planctomycetota bacterium]
MTDKEMLKDALEHEEEAIRLYRQYTEAVTDERIKEMFEQFAMNESWHASALRDKLKNLEE